MVQRETSRPRAASPQGLKLVYERDGERVAYPIPEGETFIGRKDYCDLCFPDASVSKRHVRIVREGATIELFDAGSRNGTVVNGENVDRVVLQPGDVIQVGKITLKVAGEAGEGASASRKPARSNDSFKDFDDFDEESTRRETGWTSQASRAKTAAGESPGSVKDLDTAAVAKKASKAKVVAEVEPAEDAAAAPKAKFTITAGDGKGKAIELDPNNVITIGTKEENAIPLKGEGISRYHAEVLVENGVWVLKDLGSRNGTFVAGRKVDLHELASGDEVQVGTVLLRFHQDAAPGKPAEGITSAKVLLDKVKQDPKAFLQSQQGKHAIIAVVGIVFLVVLLMPGYEREETGPGGKGSKTPRGQFTHQVIEQLKADNGSKALDMLARNPKLLQESATLRDLNDLAKTWEAHQQPLTFDWNSAGGQIEKVQRSGARELDKDCLEWLALAAKEVDEEQPNYRLTVRGSGELLRAGGLRGREFKGYVEALRNAYDAYRSVPRGSRLKASSDVQAQKARLLLFAALRDEAVRLAAMDPPPWGDAVALLRQALEYGETLDEKQPILRKMEEYDAAQKDEDSFAKAVDIVQRREVPRYDEAIALLKAVRKESRVYMDAQTYLHWIGADRDVRSAKVAYDSGDWERALGLLNSALKVTELGPEAKQSVTRRIEQWGRVVQTFNRGMAAYDRSSFDEARVAFAEVKKYEQNPKNRYRQRAEAQVDAIDGRTIDVVRTAMKDGLDYVNSGRYAEAFDKWRQVVERTNNDPKLRGQMAQATAKVNKEKRLFDTIKRRWTTFNPNSIPNGELLTMLYSLKLLKVFLPLGHEDREASGELYKKVKEYVDREKRQRAAERDDDEVPDERPK